MWRAGALNVGSLCSYVSAGALNVMNVGNVMNMENKRASAAHFLTFARQTHFSMRIAPIVLFFLFLLPCLSLAQQPVEEGAKVRIEWARQLEYHREGGKEVQILKGNVRIQHDSVFLFCDEAVVVNQTDVTARGNVVILQGDSLAIFSDSLFYGGRTKKSDLWGNVVLQHKDEKLFTDSLHYDLRRRIAYYEHRALLTNDTTQLRSLRGEYYVDRDEAVFHDSVTVVDPHFELQAEELRFNTRTQTVYFEGPTLISLGEERDSRIYCEDGFYDIPHELAEFAERPQYLNGDMKATSRLIRYDAHKGEVQLLGEALLESDELHAEAEQIRYDEVNDVFYLEGQALYEGEGRNIRAERIVYDRRHESYSTEGRSLISEPPTLLEAGRTRYVEESGLAIADRGVVWRDTSAGLTIECERAEYLKEQDQLLATGGERGRPLLIVESEEDSLFLAADTLFAHRGDTLSGDSSRVLHAYRDVRIFKRDLQAACDSLVYYEGDSLFRLFDRPAMWFDTTQLTGDTIEIQLANRRVSRIRLWEHALIANSTDLLLFNQISGREVNIYFSDNEPRELLVSGNVESVYYLQDESKAYIGVNRSTSAEMRILFEDGQISKIYSLRQIDGLVLPVREGLNIRLGDFEWQQERRPFSVGDLFLTVKSEARHEE